MNSLIRSIDDCMKSEFNAVSISRHNSSSYMMKYPIEKLAWPVGVLVCRGGTTDEVRGGADDEAPVAEEQDTATC